MVIIMEILAPTSQSKSNWSKRRWWLACWSRAGTRSASKNPTCFHRWSPWLTRWSPTFDRPSCCATTKLLFWSTTHPVLTYYSVCLWFSILNMIPSSLVTMLWTTWIARANMSYAMFISAHARHNKFHTCVRIWNDPMTKKAGRGN